MQMHLVEPEVRGEHGRTEERGVRVRAILLRLRPPPAGSQGLRHRPDAAIRRQREDIDHAAAVIRDVQPVLGHGQVTRRRTVGVLPAERNQLESRRSRENASTRAFASSTAYTTRPPTPFATNDGDEATAASPTYSRLPSARGRSAPIPCPAPCEPV